MSDLAFVDDDHGEGICISLAESKIAAPFDGMVLDVNNQKHTIRLLSENGMMLDMCLSQNFDASSGNIFEASVKVPERIRKGDTVAFIDTRNNNNADHIDIALIIINSKDYLGILPVKMGKVDYGDLIVTTIVSETLQYGKE
jgi:phosphotransferase system IIA component